MDYSETWKKYVKSLEEAAHSEIGASWNKHRQLIMIDDRKKKQILLKEITKNNCNVYIIYSLLTIYILQDPLNLIEKEYRNDNFEGNLLADRLTQIKNIFDEESTTLYILETKEILEIKKKVIETYLNFLVKENFELISNIFFNSN